MSKNVLVVDDTETNIDILIELLGDIYEVFVATDGEIALEIVNDEKIDVILLDIMMPDMDGYEVCRHIKAKSRTKDIPVIFITAKTDEASIERAYEAGGIDFVTKPFKPRELLVRIKTQLDIRALIYNLDQLASYDMMTGIYNRRKFFELSEALFKDKKENLYAVMIDIDKFKNINDTYGHSVGDVVIKKVAEVVEKNIINATVFGRIGGEEFAIICHETSSDRVEEKIDSLRKMVEALEINIENNEVIKVTISEGVSAADEETKTLDDLLKRADEALYDAKGSGRNRVVFR